MSNVHNPNQIISRKCINIKIMYLLFYVFFILLLLILLNFNKNVLFIVCLCTVLYIGCALATIIDFIHSIFNKILFVFMPIKPFEF